MLNLLRRPEHNTDRLHPPATDVTVWRHTSTPAYVLMVRCLTKHRGLNQIFLLSCFSLCKQHFFCTGDAKDIESQEKKIYDIAEKYGGIPAGETNGERGYMLTFVIAYIRVSAVLLCP